MNVIKEWHKTPAAYLLPTAASFSALAWLFFGSGQKTLGGLTGLLFNVVLIWALARSIPKSAPALDDGALKSRLGFWLRFGLVSAGVLVSFGLGMVIGAGAGVLLASGLIGLGLSLAWRRELAARLVLSALGTGLFCAFGIAWLGNGDLTWAIFNGLCLPPALSAGALLVRRTGLARSHWLEGHFLPGLRGFLAGCALGLPVSVFNLFGNMQRGDTWVHSPWQALYAFVPALAEETWARLFLVGLCYYVLLPASQERPRRALFAAVLVGALVHGFSHSGINPLGLLIGSLLYGLPAGLLLVRRDFEHAVGYHFVIDLVRFAAAFW